MHIPPATTSVPISSSIPGSTAAPVSAPPPTAAPPHPITATTTAAFDQIEFSSNSSSSSHGFDEDGIEEDEHGGEPSDTGGTSRKRKSKGGYASSTTTKMAMEYLEGLMKQVIHKQESLQQRFLEALEKREQDRVIREEAWQRQETLRLTREHELVARERAVASSRDEVIMIFLEKITGQTIQLPTNPSLNQQQHPQPRQHMVLQEIGGSGSYEPASSRWPKEEVLALINLRSGLDSSCQDVGPKGPLWEEISAGMSRMGYKRNPKRCKEKWENINKYYKKVKESSKKRPEDAKTCPYFHQLDALHRGKLSGGGSAGGLSSFGCRNRPEEETSLPQQDSSDASLLRQPSIDDKSENKTGTTVDGGASKKPGITVRELMEDQGLHLQQHHKGQSLLVDGYDQYDDYDV